MVATTTQIAAAIACLTASSNAFSPSVGRAVVNKNNNSIRPLFAEAPDGPKDGTTITSARKEIGYDAASGRFFETDLEDCSPDENEYCVVDKETGQLVSLTLEEKERIFLDALQVSLISMQYWGFSICIVPINCNYLYIIRSSLLSPYISCAQSFYYSGRQLLEDSEFDLLKEDLAWNGSTMVNMNRQETKYLAAMEAYSKGQPILSDDEFDTLKKELKEEGSPFASSKEPKCYIGEWYCSHFLLYNNMYLCV